MPSVYHATCGGSIIMRTELVIKRLSNFMHQNGKLNATVVFSICLCSIFMCSSNNNNSNNRINGQNQLWRHIVAATHQLDFYILACNSRKDLAIWNGRENSISIPRKDYFEFFWTFFKREMRQLRHSIQNVKRKAHPPIWLKKKVIKAD